jgi:hypothetical protein
VKYFVIYDLFGAEGMQGKINLSTGQSAEKQ